MSGKLISLSPRERGEKRGLAPNFQHGPSGLEQYRKFGACPLFLHALLLAIALATASLAAAQDPVQAAAAGSRAYERGDFREAAKDYELALRYGAHSGALYYDLGNAYFKLGKLGEAILAYERARKELGDDPDLRYNLDYASSLIVDKIQAPEENVYFKGLSYLHNLLSNDQTAFAFLACYGLASLLGLAAILGPFGWRRRFAYCAAGLLVLTLLVGSSLAAKMYTERAFEHGIILAEKVYARSGPGENNTSIFEIHEGLKVQVHNRRSGWVQISLPNGFNGWVPEDSIGVI